MYHFCIYTVSLLASQNSGFGHMIKIMLQKATDLLRIFIFFGLGAIMLPVSSGVAQPSSSDNTNQHIFMPTGITPVDPLPSPAPTYDITTRSRWGATGFESVIFTPGNPSPTGVQLNPTGTPAWSVGNYHPFSFTYSAYTGVITWSIDFNRDGDFLDSEESKSSTSSTLIGYQFKYLNLWMSGSSNAPNTVDVRNFTVNGSNLGSFTSNANTTPIEWSWTDDSGWFQEVVVTGEYRMSASGNSGESNRMWLRLGEKQLITYTISYNGNSNIGGTAPSNQTKDYGVNLALANNSGNLVRTGYTFNGWNTQADGLGADYAAGSNYTTNAALTLYAKWTPDTYPVTYNGNNNTGGTAPSNQTKTYGVNLLLASNSGNLVRTGYTFNGWNTQADGLGADYAAGSNYTTNAALTLYAKWTPDTYPVTYNGNSNTGGTAPSN